MNNILKNMLLCMLIINISSCSALFSERSTKITEVEDNIEEFISIKNYIELKNYHDNFKTSRPIEDISNCKDTVLCDFMKKYHILTIYINSNNERNKLKNTISLVFNRSAFQAREQIIFDYNEKEINYELILNNTKKLNGRMFYIKQ